MLESLMLHVILISMYGKLDNAGKMNMCTWLSVKL